MKSRRLRNIERLESCADVEIQTEAFISENIYESVAYHGCNEFYDPIAREFWELKG